MSNKLKTVVSEFVCLECGNIVPLSRIKGRQRKEFHLKKLYCYKCNKEVNHVEVKKWDIAIKKLEYQENRTEEEQKVYSLLLKR